MFSSLAGLMWMQWGTHWGNMQWGNWLLILTFQLPQNLLCVWPEIYRSSMLSDPLRRMWPFHQTGRQSIAPSQDWTHDLLSAQQLPVNVRVRTFNHSASFLHRTAWSQTGQSGTDAIGCVLSLCRFSRSMCHQQDSSCLRTVWVGSPQPFGWDWSLWASTSSFSSLACTWCLCCPPTTALTTPRESRSPSMLVNRVLMLIQVLLLEMLNYKS